MRHAGHRVRPVLRHRRPAASRGEAAPADEAVSAIAKAHHATPAQVRLAWTLHRGPHVLAIPGTGDPAHLTENIDTAALRLSPQEISYLAAAPLPSSPDPGAPPN